MMRLISQFPVFGGLTDCKRKHHLGALGEFTITLSFTTATFWLSATVEINKPKDNEQVMYKILSINKSPKLPFTGKPKT